MLSTEQKTIKDLITKFFSKRTPIQQEQLLQYAIIHSVYESTVKDTNNISTLTLSLNVLNDLFDIHEILELTNCVYDSHAKLEFTLSSKDEFNKETAFEDIVSILKEGITNEISLLLASSDYSKLGFINKPLIQNLNISTDIHGNTNYKCFINVSIE